MIEGRIKSIDVAQRTAVITTRENEDVTVTFPDGTTIEVAEPETMGTMGGELTDLQEGYYVEVEVGSKGDDGTCACASLVCVS
jgi:hypothetical protein